MIKKEISSNVFEIVLPNITTSKNTMNMTKSKAANDILVYFFVLSSEIPDIINIEVVIKSIKGNIENIESFLFLKYHYSNQEGITYQLISFH